ncbi:SET domain-containing protein-lysine N-methyltransferase [Patescibacteria group bacterium]|nr:SET domain-containing protein-lysine N-methyltransferase [Patescibacteria group bacterium]
MRQKFTLKVRRSQTGKGLFTTELIPKNSYIIEYIGKNVKKSEQENVRGKYFFWTSKDEMINGNIPRNIARYINHSCQPSCEATGPKGHIYISSLRAIKSGEELTYHYGKEYFDKYIKPKGCKCKKCFK